MKKEEISIKELLPNKQEKLFLYDKYFELFVTLYKNNLLPKKILITGQSGIGKSTFAYHFINFLLSEKENYSYDYKNFTINHLNKTFGLIKKNFHPNFYLIENFIDKRNIDIKQIRNMINYVNKTSFNKQIKFVLIDNAECLNLHSVNALLKIVEEPTSNTFFIFIHNSSIKLTDTLRSRCIEFKINFTNQQKQKIIEFLLSYYNLRFDKKILEEIWCMHNSPGIVLNFIKLTNEIPIDPDKTNLLDIIFYLMEYNLKNKNNTNLDLLQNCIELFFYKKIKKYTNKNKILLNYSKVIKQLNLLKKYNIDMNNTFYEIKENIVHG